MTDMKKNRFDEQIIGFLKQAEAGMPVKELCRLGGFSDATFYKWRAKFGGMQARREAVARMVDQLAISERRACRHAVLSRTSYPEPPRMNAAMAELNTRIVELAHECQRFDYRRIHDLLALKRRHANHKRVWRLDKLANRSVRKCRKVRRPISGCQPLAASQYVNDTWSMVMDELANGWRIKSLTQARQEITRWRWDYNEVRPHSSLGRIPPARWRCRAIAGDQVISKNLDYLTLARLKGQVTGCQRPGQSRKRDAQVGS
ncbi:integrase core domain-containing protein [Diaphorobacter sp.]|uniref:integrase core domain-containing protein n=1 Tax=Diaphorobacter sp. TaxID=1934310 RepID=UPI00338DEBE5